jgi:calcineurin-like phosphoesterase family protein
MIFFTSDQHFGHANIIRFCDRPFADTDEMNDALIANWNAVVTNRDAVYIVGDLMFRLEIEPEVILRQLKGKKRLIIGNHDKSWMPKVELNRHFESVEHYQIIAASEGKVTLCHYPMMSFGSKWHIFGHIHNNKPDSFWPLLRSMDNALNASVEVNNYRPATFDELIYNNTVFRQS